MDVAEATVEHALQVLADRWPKPKDSRCCCFPFDSDPSAHCSQDPIVVIGFNTNSVCPLAALRLVRDLPRFVFYESHMSFELDRAYSTMNALTMLESDSSYSQCVIDA